MKICTLIFGLFIINPIFSQENKKIDWNKDIEFLKKKLPREHINLFSEKSETEFHTELESIKSSQNNLTDFGLAVKLQQLISSFGDSHTNVDWRKFADKNQILPLRLYWFSDGIYIIQSLKENQNILGTKIIKINQIPIKVIVDSLSTLITLDNDAIVKKSIPNLISYVQLLEYFNFVKDGKVIFETEDLAGLIVNYEIQPGLMDPNNSAKCHVDSLIFCDQNAKELFIDKYFEEENIYYVLYNNCFSRESPPPYFRGNPKELPSFVDFTDKIIETINSKPINKLIVDLRYNAGGTSTQGTELIRRLSTIEKINQKGKLFVIIGRSTFSSAIINALDFKKMTKAIFVGEETSGKPNHFGEVKSFNLPNSGLSVYFSTKYFKRTSKDFKTVAPDFKIETSFVEFVKGIDPVYKWIIKQ